MKPENEAKALEVGRLLGFAKDTESNNWQVLFRMPDRGAMTICDSKQRGKLVVDMWPAHELVEHRRTYYGKDETRPKTEIRVAETKPADTIAADIRRRLLPEYERLVKDCQERKEHADSYARNQARMLKAIAQVLGVGGTFDHKGQITNVYWNHADQYANIRADSKVTFENFHVPFECALDVARVMRRHFDNHAEQQKGE